MIDGKKPDQSFISVIGSKMRKRNIAIAAA